MREHTRERLTVGCRFASYEHADSKCVNTTAEVLGDLGGVTGGGDDVSDGTKGDSGPGPNSERDEPRNRRLGHENGVEQSWVPQPARDYSWADAAPGNQLARTHGVWAADVTDEAREILPRLFEQADIERHPLAAVLAAETWIRLRRAEADIAGRGMVLDDRPHPLLRYVSQWHRELLDVAREYGMTPRSEAEVARARADASRLAVDLDAIRARGRDALRSS
jgi:hypothetical protein